MRGVADRDVNPDSEGEGEARSHRMAGERHGGHGGVGGAGESVWVESRKEGEAMTRAQMFRTAMALAEYESRGLAFDGVDGVAEVWNVCPDWLADEDCNPRAELSRWHECPWQEACMLEASLLLSEAHRPPGHDGDGQP
jgi:hypothetical protein